MSNIEKYYKYKNKYLKLKYQMSGGGDNDITLNIKYNKLSDDDNTILVDDQTIVTDHDNYMWRIDTDMLTYDRERYMINDMRTSSGKRIYGSIKDLPDNSEMHIQLLRKIIDSDRITYKSFINYLKGRCKDIENISNTKTKIVATVPSGPIPQIVYNELKKITNIADFNKCLQEEYNNPNLQVYLSHKERHLFNIVIFYDNNRLQMLYDCLKDETKSKYELTQHTSLLDMIAENIQISDLEATSIVYVLFGDIDDNEHTKFMELTSDSLHENIKSAYTCYVGKLG